MKPELVKRRALLGAWRGAAHVELAAASAGLTIERRKLWQGCGQCRGCCRGRRLSHGCSLAEAAPPLPALSAGVCRGCRTEGHGGAPPAVVGAAVHEGAGAKSSRKCCGGCHLDLSATERRRPAEVDLRFQLPRACSVNPIECR